MVIPSGCPSTRWLSCSSVTAALLENTSGTSSRKVSFRLASALGSLASTLRRFLRFSGFYLVSALFSSISTLAMLLLKEPVVTEAQAARSSHSLRELPGQFAQLVQDSAAALRGCPLAAKLIAADAFISVPCYLTKICLLYTSDAADE